MCRGCILTRETFVPKQRVLNELTNDILNYAHIMLLGCLR